VSRECIVFEARQPDNPQGCQNYHQDNSVIDSEHECSELNPQRILDFLGKKTGTGASRDFSVARRQKNVKTNFAFC
jgi:hypothetical protein